MIIVMSRLASDRDLQAVVDRVREIHPLFRGDCALVLADGTRLKLSRSRRKDFEALFAQPRHTR